MKELNLVGGLYSRAHTCAPKSGGSLRTKIAFLNHDYEAWCAMPVDQASRASRVLMKNNNATLARECGVVQSTLM
jgi:hypothetical protein